MQDNGGGIGIDGNVTVISSAFSFCDVWVCGDHWLSADCTFVVGTTSNHHDVGAYLCIFGRSCLGLRHAYSTLSILFLEHFLIVYGVMFPSD